MKCSNCGAPMRPIKTHVGNKQSWVCSAGCGYGKARIGFKRKKGKKGKK